MNLRKEYNEQSKVVSSHRTYVENLLKHYRENDIQQGDPNEGVWHQAHYPLPKHLGGQTVVLLLREHHAVQGVLQSEEYQTPCIFNWEKKYLSGWLLERFTYWRYQLNSAAGKVGGKVAAEVNKTNGTSLFDPELRMLGTLASIGKTGFNSAKTNERNKTGFWNPDREIQSKGGKAATSQRWMCTETLKVSNVGALSMYQKARGIDTQKRIRIDPLEAPVHTYEPNI